MMDNLVMPTTVTQINQIIVDLIKIQIKISVHLARIPVSADSHREVCPDHGQVEHVPLEVLALVEEQALEEHPPVGDMITREYLDPNPVVGLVASQDSISLEEALQTLVSPEPMQIPVRPEEALEVLVSPGPMRIPVRPEEALGVLVSPEPMQIPASPEEDPEVLVSLGPMRILVRPEEALVSREPFLEGHLPEVSSTPMVVPLPEDIPVLLALPDNEDLGQVGPVVVPGVTLAPEIDSKIKKNAKDRIYMETGVPVIFT